MPRSRHSFQPVPLLQQLAPGDPDRVLMFVKYPSACRNVEDLLAERGSTSAIRQCATGGTGSAQCSPLTSVDSGQQHAWLSPVALAPRRDVREGERGDALPVACSRSRRRDPRELRHEERDKAAALTFMKKALKRHGSPDAITTDGLRSYRAAMIVLGNSDKQEVWLSWVESGHNRLYQRYHFRHFSEPRISTGVTPGGA